MRKRPNKKRHIGCIAKAHGAVCLVFIAVYLLAGLIFSPSLLFSDLNSKYRFAAHVVSATVRVWGPPSVPVVSLTPVCSGGSSYVLVNWSNDENATAYDVFRNGEELVTGLAVSAYQDNNVENEASYSYYVIARGPEGEETSAEESVVTNNCHVPDPAPEISVTRFEEFDMTSYSNVPATIDRRPEFYGTSNIANGMVRFEMYGDPIILSTTLANSNGYWSWTPASSLGYGLHTIHITVIDPLDSGRTGSTSFTFRIKRDDEEEDEDDDEETEDAQEEDSIRQSYLPRTTQTGSGESGDGQQEQGFAEIADQAPIDMSLRISEVNAVVVQGTDLSTQVYPGYTMTFEVTVASFKGVQKGTVPIFVYSILDSGGEEVYRMAEEKEVAEGEVFSKRITLPDDLEPGKYKLRIEAIVGNYSISEERYFYVEESPLVKLSSSVGSVFAHLFMNFGWLIVLALIILLILIIFAIVEYKIHHRDDPGMSGGLKNKGAH